MTRSQGAVLLARTAKTQEVIADEIRVSRISVSKWLNGRAKPAKKKRVALREAYDIPELAWDQEPASTKRDRRAPPPTSDVDAKLDTKSMADQLEQLARDFLKSLREDKTMTPLERAKCMSALAGTLNQLEKRTGDIGARLFQLPIWKRIEKALETALDGHPKAAEAVAREFRRLDQGG